MTRLSDAQITRSEDPFGCVDRIGPEARSPLAPQDGGDLIVAGVQISHAGYNGCEEKTVCAR
jgi:hypothetical protein